MPTPTRWLIDSVGDPLGIAGTIDVHEVGGDGASLTESFGSKGFTASTILRVPWANRYTVMDALITNNSAYPRAISAGVYATNASSVPAPGQISAEPTHEELIVPEYAHITVAYSAGESNGGAGGVTAGGERFTESFEPNGRFQTIGVKKLMWRVATVDDTGAWGPMLTQEEAPSIPQLAMDYVQTRYGLSAIPVEVLKPNHANEDDHSATLLGITFPAETLLYVNSQMQRTTGSGGTSKWTMASRFRYQKDGWNKFWNAKLGEWCEIWTADFVEGDREKRKPFPLLTATELGHLII